MIFLYFSDFKPLLDCMGLYFQIRDDYANLISKEVSLKVYNRSENITSTICKKLEDNMS